MVKTIIIATNNLHRDKHSVFETLPRVSFVRGHPIQEACPLIAKSLVRDGVERYVKSTQEFTVVIARILQNIGGVWILIGAHVHVLEKSRPDVGWIIHGWEIFDTIERNTTVSFVAKDKSAVIRFRVPVQTNGKPSLRHHDLFHIVSRGFGFARWLRLRLGRRSLSVMEPFPQLLKFNVHGSVETAGVFEHSDTEMTGRTRKAI